MINGAARFALDELCQAEYSAVCFGTTAKIIKYVYFG